MNVQRKLSMPYWCVGNPVGDPFGPAVMDRISSVEVTDILCEANKLADDSDVNRIQDRLWNSHRSVEKILQGGDLQAIEKAAVDYTAVNEEPLELGMLDLMVNKKIMGL